MEHEVAILVHLTHLERSALHDHIAHSLTEFVRTGENVIRLGWVGLGWVGLGWVGLGWVGLGWVGLGWVGLG